MRTATIDIVSPTFENKMEVSIPQVHKREYYVFFMSRYQAKINKNDLKSKYVVYFFFTDQSICWIRLRLGNDVCSDSECNDQ